MRTGSADLMRSGIAPSAETIDDVTPASLTVTFQKPLNLFLPDQFRASSARRREFDQSLALINSSLPSEIAHFNGRALLITIPMEFDQADLFVGGLAMAAMMAITVTNSEVRILKDIQYQKSPGMDRTMNFGRNFGEGLGRTLLASSVVWALVTDDNKKFVDIVPVQLQAVVVAGLANNVLKMLFRRALPTPSPQMIHIIYQRVIAHRTMAFHQDTPHLRS